MFLRHLNLPTRRVLHAANTPFSDLIRKENDRKSERFHVVTRPLFTINVFRFKSCKVLRKYRRVPVYTRRLCTQIRFFLCLSNKFDESLLIPSVYERTITFRLLEITSCKLRNLFGNIPGTICFETSNKGTNKRRLV